jgi:hypothetical protein
MAPEFPDVAVPELKTSAPLTPATPELADRMLTIPELVAVPSPDPMLTVPPVFTVLRPAYISTKPPEPDVPLPPVTRIRPAPVSAKLVPSMIDPEFPDDAVPELKRSIPLTPAAPAFRDLTVTCPDVVRDPMPDITIK